MNMLMQKEILVKHFRNQLNMTVGPGTNPITEVVQDRAHLTSFQEFAAKVASGIDPEGEQVAHVA